MKNNVKKQVKYIIGNAQTLGEMEFQSNYFATSIKPNLVAVIADGGIDHINGRRAAVIAVDNISGAFTENILNKEHFNETIHNACLKTIQNIKDYIYKGRMPSLSVSVLCVSESNAYFYSIGSIRIYVYNDKNIRDISGLSLNNSYDIKDADNFMMVSQGGYEALTQVEMFQFLQNNIYGRYDERAYNKAIKIVGEIDRKNVKNAKNATVVLLEGEI